MSKSVIINPAQEQEKENSLHQPHGLFVVDQLLKVHTDSYTTTISLGMRNPTGLLAPAFSVKMPLPFALELAHAIIAEVESKKEQIKADHTELHKVLK